MAAQPEKSGRAWLAGALLVAALPLAAQAPPVPAEPPQPRFVVERFVVDGESPLPQAEVDRVLSPFLGEHEGIGGLLSAADALEGRLVESGYTFHRVVLPPQTLTGGEVHLEIVAFELKKVTVEGNEFFDTANIRRSLPSLRTGATPDTAKLARERLQANRHASKQVQVRLSESEEEAGLDALVVVEDSRPWSLFSTLNNTGSKETGNTRLTVGGQLSNLWNRDHVFGGTYTISPRELDKVEQIGGNYSIPIYRTGSNLSGYVVSSNVDSGVVAGTDVTGAGEFWGVSLSQILPRHGAYSHNFTVSFDDKLFVNNVFLRDFFPGTAFPDLKLVADVRTRPLGFTYDGSFERESGSNSFYVRYVRNIPGGTNGGAQSYAGAPPGPPDYGIPQGRPGAKPQWHALRYGGDVVHRLDNELLFRGRMEGQVTDQPLVSGEQFGVGGAGSVRGYEERELSGDIGMFGSGEVWSPVLYRGLRVIGFFDIGYRSFKEVALPGDPSFTPGLGNLSNVIAGTGAGLRWAWRDNVSLDMDVAVALRSAGPSTVGGLATGYTQEGHVKVHFNVLVRY